jgi:hypothetical protein
VAGGQPPVTPRPPVTPVSPVTPVVPVTPVAPVTPEEPAATPPTPGAYFVSGNGSTLFYVSPDSSQAQDVSIGVGFGSVKLRCSTGKERSYNLTVANITIESNTTFSGNEKEEGWIEGKAVKITSSFMGHFDGLDSDGTQRAAGTFRDELAFEGGETCTSGNQAWAAQV